MEAVYSEALTKSVKELFTTMMSLDLEEQEIIHDRKGIEGGIAITGMIGLAGSYKGNIAIHFSKSLALKSISAMLGMEFDELTDDTKDAIGEIANIVAGGVKTELSAEGINFDLSLPTVICGENYSIFFNEADKKNDAFIFPFALGEEKIYIEFDLKPAAG